MKKVLCLILVMLMLLPSSMVLGATKEAGAYLGANDTYNVYIEGKAEAGGQSVNVLLTNGDAIAYIEELETDEYGKYISKFEYDGSIKDCTVIVRDAETATDITGSLNTAFAQKDVCSIEISLRKADNTITNYITADDFVDVFVDIDNKYGDESNVKVMVAAYDEHNQLLGTEIETFKLGYNDIETRKKVQFDDMKLPEGTMKAKAFIWQDTVNLMPLAKEDTKINMASARPTKYVNENPENTKVIGIMGASTTHEGRYTAFLYQYYATRYPGSNIILLNKGAAGDGPTWMLERMEWDIYNENDPLGYGACDEVYVCLGGNELSYAAYTDGRMDEDEYEDYYNGVNKYQNDPNKIGQTVPSMRKRVDAVMVHYKELLQWAKENNKIITVGPPTIFDESDNFESTLSYGICRGANHVFGMLADELEKFAAENDMPYVNLWRATNEMTDEIRASHPEATTVITRSDGIHHSDNGGYLVGYAFVRGQETDEIVASVEIDANNGSTVTDTATVSDLNYSVTGVSYNYLAGALPLYAKSAEYKYAENFDVDITNTMNKEIIKVTGLEEGTYTIKMDGVEVCKVSANDLANGVNVGIMDNNPGQIQSKAAYDNYYARRKTYEGELRTLCNCEHWTRVANYKLYGVAYNDPMYASLTADEWVALCLKLKAQTTITGSENYATNKYKQDTFVAEVRACIDGLAKDTIPTQHLVEIYK